MSLKTFDFGPISVSCRIGEPLYSKRETVNQDPAGFKIIRQETENQQTDEVRYSYMLDGEEIVFIRGHYKSPEKFYIDRIENATKDKSSGKYIPTVFAEMERDLKERGVTHLSTVAIAKLAPILVKRYGFVEKEGRDYDSLKSKWAQKIPGKAFTLEKEI